MMTARTLGPPGSGDLALVCRLSRVLQFTSRQVFVAHDGLSQLSGVPEHEPNLSFLSGTSVHPIAGFPDRAKLG